LEVAVTRSWDTPAYNIYHVERETDLVMLNIYWRSFTVLSEYAIGQRPPIRPAGWGARGGGALREVGYDRDLRTVKFDLGVLKSLTTNLELNVFERVMAKPKPAAVGVESNEEIDGRMEGWKNTLGEG